MSDPMENMIEDALNHAGVPFRREEPPHFLDFYLPTMGVFIEVKRFHSERVLGQMKRVDNIIVAQGFDAVHALAAMIRMMRPA